MELGERSCAAVHAELLVDVLEVLADRGRGQPELLGDLGVALSQRDEVEHLALALRQPRERLGFGGALAEEEHLAATVVGEVDGDGAESPLDDELARDPREIAAGAVAPAAVEPFADRRWK